MRISDWSSDVCSSDLPGSAPGWELLINLPSSCWLLQAPGVDDRRFRLPDGGLIDPRKVGEAAEFRGHGHPVVGLGQHRRLAGDLVAQHGEAVAGAHGEGIEAVEVLEPGLERLAEAGAFAQSIGEIAGRHLAVVIGLLLQAAVPQPLAQVIVVAERAVMQDRKSTRLHSSHYSASRMPPYA